MTVLETTADDPRIVGLRRMRTLATLLLVFMAVVLVATSYGQAHWPWLAYVRAFAEAGVVGACADWFAVVALFRHPFGVPIPHTAIVPRNKARIAGAMGRFISNNFLTPKVLSARLGRVDAAGWVVDWLSQPENTSRIARVVALALPEIVRALPREQIGQMAQEQLHRGLAAVPAAPVASHLLAIAWAQGQTQKLIERSLELIETSLTGNKDVIRHKLEAGSSRWVPRWFDGMVAEKVFTALMATLSDMRDPAHPWRVELKATIETLIERLKTDPELSARIEALKADVIADPLFHDQLRAIWAEIENRLPSDASVYSERIAAVTEAALAGAVRWLADNPPVQRRINRWMRYLIRRTIAPRRAEIGAFVTQVVENWDTTTLVNRVELQVGKDLQYIRINGTLVGGLVGLVIYTASVWLLPG
jgi:uncharacterized membrane-anchored protein YjiN (DUF445 family)